MLERLEALPGVESATAATSVPLTGRASRSGHRLQDRFEAGKNRMPFVFEVTRIPPGYFETMGIPLLRGRDFVRADVEARRAVVVVNRSLAERFWPNENPIGERIFPGTPEEGQEWFEVVGVVGDVRGERLTLDPDPSVYYPWVGPLSEESDADGPLEQTVVLRTDGDPRRLIDAVQDSVWEIDPEIPLAEIETLEQLVRRARIQMTFLTVMLLLAAGVSVSLAAVGTYGVISQLVAQRRTEIGVRMALGARRRDVHALVLREGLTLALAGGACGIAASAALVRLMLSLPIPSTRPSSRWGRSVVVSLLACAVPAHRAAAVPPAVALREE